MKEKKRIRISQCCYYCNYISSTLVGMASSSFASHTTGRVPDLYAVLGVTPSATEAELARRYKSLSLHYHPDRAAYRAGSSKREEEEMLKKYQEITAAHEVLSDPQRRAKYDAQHGVNFGRRAEFIRETIQRHNSNVAGQCSNTRDACELPASFCKRAREEGENVSASQGGEGSSDTTRGSDSEEEYLPSETKRASVTLREDAPRLVAVPAPLPPSFTEDSGACTEAVQRWRGATLHRMHDASWGLLFSSSNPTVVVDCVDGSVPVPSVLIQVNERNIRKHDAADELLNPRTEGKEGFGPHLFSLDGASTLRVYTGDEGCDATTTSAVQELSIVVTYASYFYDVWGDWALLSRDDSAVSQLVPHPKKPEIPELFKGVSVLSVNGTPVGSGEELRDALRREARNTMAAPPRSDSLGGGAASNSNRSLRIECSSLEGLPSSLLS